MPSKMPGFLLGAMALALVQMTQADSFNNVRAEISRTNQSTNQPNTTSKIETNQTDPKLDINIGLGPEIGSQVVSGEAEDWEVFGEWVDEAEDMLRHSRFVFDELQDRMGSRIVEVKFYDGQSQGDENDDLDNEDMNAELSCDALSPNDLEAVISDLEASVGVENDEDRYLFSTDEDYLMHLTKLYEYQEAPQESEPSPRVSLNAFLGGFGSKVAEKFEGVKYNVSGMAWKEIASISALLISMVIGVGFVVSLVKGRKSEAGPNLGAHTALHPIRLVEVQTDEENQPAVRV